MPPKPAVGSQQWIKSESSVIQNLVYTDLEYFAYAARGDLEWLDERLKDILNRNQRDLKRLLQTPARLRGVLSPRKRALLQNDNGNKNSLKVASPLQELSVNRDQQRRFGSPALGSMSKSPMISEWREDDVTSVVKFDQLAEQQREQCHRPREMHGSETDEESSFLAISKSINKRSFAAADMPSNEPAEKRLSVSQVPLTAPPMDAAPSQSSDEHVSPPEKAQFFSQRTMMTYETDLDSPAPGSTFGFAPLPAREPLTKNSIVTKPSEDLPSLSFTNTTTATTSATSTTLMSTSAATTSTTTTTASLRPLSATRSFTQPATDPSEKEHNLMKPAENQGLEANRRGLEEIFSEAAKESQELKEQESEPHRHLSKDVFKCTSSASAQQSKTESRVAESPGKELKKVVSNSTKNLPTLAVPPPTAELTHPTPEVNKSQSSITPGSVFSFTTEALRRARQLFFDSVEPSKETNANGETPLIESTPQKPATKPKPDAWSRLMAPTFASASKNNLSPTKDAPPKPITAKLYPDVSKVLFSGSRKTVKRVESQLFLSPIKTKPPPVRVVEYSDVKGSNVSTSTPSDVIATASRAIDAVKTNKQELTDSRPSAAIDADGDPNPKDHIGCTERQSVRVKGAIGPATSLARTSLAKKATTRPVVAIHAIKPTSSTAQSANEKSLQSQPEAKSLRRNLTLEEEKNKQPPRTKPLVDTPLLSHKSSLQDRTVEVKASKAPTLKSVKSNIKMNAQQEEKKVKSGPSEGQLKAPLDAPESAPALNPTVKVSKQVMSLAPGQQSSQQANHQSNPPLFGKLNKVSYTPHSSLMKSAMHNQTKNFNAPPPPVDGVKFSSDKIKFAGAQPGFKKVVPVSTPGEPKKAVVSANPYKQIPMVSEFLTTTLTTGDKGDDIVLPEIMSDSEDDEDGNVLRSWANSPDLRNMVLDQQNIDPDTVFGPVAPLHMDEVFKNSGRLSRFRPRSSSANWSGTDKLSAQEMVEYAKEMGYNK